MVRSLGAFEAYLNGELAAATNLDRNGYYEYKVQGAAAKALKPGANTLAIRALRIREKKEGQVFDASLLASRPLRLPPAGAQDFAKASWVVVANTILNLDEAFTRR